MKTKLFLLCSLLIAVFLNVNASERNDSTGTPIPLRDIPPGSLDHGEFNRAPAAPFIIYQDGHTLNFGIEYAGCAVILIDGNDAIVFSGMVGTDGFMALPEYLEGVYVIRFIFSDIVFQGEIEL